VFEAAVPVLAEFEHGDFTVLAGTEDLLLLSPAPSSDICMVKDIQCVTINQKLNTQYTGAAVVGHVHLCRVVGNTV